MCGRLACAVGVAGAVIAGLALPAHASDDDRTATGWGTQSGGGVAVAAPVTPGGGGGGGATCSYTPWLSDVDEEPGPAPPVGTSYYAIRDCDGQVDVVLIPNAPPAVSAIELARQAFAEVATPGCSMRTSPRPDVVVVQIETWLWLECPWVPISATAGVPGLSATVTATPGDVIWDMGDGAQATCEGPGVVWDPTIAVEEQSTYCSYEYRRSSSGEPNGAYTVTATVSWSVSWSASSGEGGSLPTVSRSSSTPIRVGEVQALSTQ